MRYSIQVLLVSLWVSSYFVVTSYSQVKPANTLSSRFLSLFSTTIVEAKPSVQGSTLSESWTVTRVLHQDQSTKIKIKPGQQIQLEKKKLDLLVELKHCFLKKTNWKMDYKDQIAYLKKTKTAYTPSKIKSALLYVVNVSGAKEKPVFACQRGGVRLLMEDCSVLAPHFDGDTGVNLFCHFVPLEKSWKRLLDEVSENAPKAELFRKLPHIKDKRERAVKLLQWMEDHRKEFTGFGLKCTGYEESRDAGWYYHENSISSLIDGTGQCDLVWQAIVNANRHPVVGMSGYNTFCNLEGRKWLLDNVFTKDATLENLQIGFQTLSGAIWYSEKDNRNPSDKERETILKKLIPYLKCQSPTIRLAAIRCVYTVSIPRVSLQVAPNNYSKDKTALSQVSKLFQQESDLSVRYVMADYLLELVDEDEWQRFSGSQALMTVFGSASVMNDLCFFRLDVRCPEGIVECDGFPEIVCERIENSKIMETKKVQPDFYSKPTGYPSWYDRNRLSGKISRKSFRDGRWRFYTTGKLKNGKAWKGEYFELEIKPAKPLNAHN